MAPGKRRLRAEVYALVACDAFLFLEGNFNFGAFAFGIVAPETGKGTAFEKQDGSYSRTVVKGISSDLQYQCAAVHNPYSVLSISST